MRILYGIQTTGRGHLVRARSLIDALKRRGHSVRALLSGPPIEAHWLDGIVEDWTQRRGLTHISVDGRISYWQTARQLRLREFLRDVRSVDARDCDLVVCDYEPITARVARRARLPSIGVGHLYAFAHGSVPVAGRNVLNTAIMRRFAPVSRPVGLHWHHFGAAVLPPTIPPDVPSPEMASETGPVVVYLSFEHRERVLAALAAVPDVEFRLYASVPAPLRRGHVEILPLARDAFVADLVRARGVICNTGFSLISEALHLGKRVLTKPTRHQTEQESNALALTQLGLATVVDRIDAAAVRRWLAEAPAITPAAYPDVMTAVADWIAAGQWGDPSQLAATLWAEVGGVRG